MIVVPTRAETLSDIVAFLKARQPDLSTSLDTPTGGQLEAVVEALRGLWAALRAAEKDIFPQTASPAALELHAELRLGQGARRGATSAAGAAALKATGDAASVVVVGASLVHSDGTRYRTTTGGTLPASGELLCSLQAISVGEATNKLAGDSLSWESPAAGLDPTAEIVVDLEGGLEQETLAELLVRLLHAFQNPPAGGRFSDYWAWAMAVAGVASAYIYGPSSYGHTGRRGLGVIDVAILQHGTGAGRLPSADLVATVQAAIDLARPGGTKDVAVLTPAAQTQAIDVQVDPQSGYEWDWNDIDHTVSSWTPATRTLVFSPSLPAVLEVGHRLLCGGELMVVESLEALSNAAVLEEAFDSAPAGGTAIWPAGPLTASVQAAITAYIDSLGPARSSAADPHQVWDDTLRKAQLDRAVCNVVGVEDCTIVTPSTNVAPTDHAPAGTVDLIVPGVITVRP